MGQGISFFNPRTPTGRKLLALALVRSTSSLSIGLVMTSGLPLMIKLFDGDTAAITRCKTHTQMKACACRTLSSCTLQMYERTILMLLTPPCFLWSSPDKHWIGTNHSRPFCGSSHWRSHGCFRSSARDAGVLSPSGIAPTGPCMFPNKTMCESNLQTLHTASHYNCVCTPYSKPMTKR